MGWAHGGGGEFWSTHTHHTRKVKHTLVGFLPAMNLLELGKSYNLVDMYISFSFGKIIRIHKQNNDTQ